MIDPLQQPVNPSNQQKVNEEYKKAMLDLQRTHDQKLLALFNSPEGDAVLEMWDDFYLRQAVIIPGAPAGTDEMREGRNAFIRTIRATVNRARGLK